MKIQEEKIMQEIIRLAEKNVIIPYKLINVVDTKKYPPIEINRSRYRVYDIKIKEYIHLSLAAKFIPEDALDIGSSELIEFTRDTTCLTFVTHENIVHCYGVAKIYHHTMDYRAIVMEKLETDLYAIIQTNAKGGTLPRTKEALIYALGIARGMTHLHKLGLLHRDLKSKNILISIDSIAKISDFGQSRSTIGEMTPWEVGNYITNSYLLYNYHYYCKINLIIYRYTSLHCS